MENTVIDASTFTVVASTIIAIPEWAKNAGTVQIVFGVASVIAGIIGTIVSIIKRAGWIPQLVRIAPWFARPFLKSKLIQLGSIAEVKFPYPQDASPDMVNLVNAERRKWVVSMVRIASAWAGWAGAVIQWAFASMTDEQIAMIYEAALLAPTRELRKIIAAS